MLSGCPGSAGVKGTPTLKVKNCPECGKELELFSSEMSTTCPGCGFVIYSDTQTCLLWCKYAKDCVGEEIYNQFMEHIKEKEAAEQNSGAPEDADSSEQGNLRDARKTNQIGNEIL